MKLTTIVPLPGDWTVEELDTVKRRMDIPSRAILKNNHFLGSLTLEWDTEVYLD